MKWLLLMGVALGLAACESEPTMGDAVHEMVQAQTDHNVQPDNVGGAMAGIGDKVGEAYRGHVDKPQDVKESSEGSFFER